MALAILSVATACATGSAPEENAPFTDEEKKQCLSTPAVTEYITRLRERVLAAWSPPPGFAPDQELKVAIRYGLKETGQVEHVRLVSESSDELSASVLAALLAAQPFGEVPSEAACLLRSPLTATFSLRVQP